MRGPERRLDAGDPLAKIVELRVPRDPVGGLFGGPRALGPLLDRLPSDVELRWRGLVGDGLRIGRARRPTR